MWFQNYTIPCTMKTEFIFYNQLNLHHPNMRLANSWSWWIQLAIWENRHLFWFKCCSGQNNNLKCILQTLGNLLCSLLLEVWRGVQPSGEWHRDSSAALLRSLVPLISEVVFLLWLSDQWASYWLYMVTTISLLLILGLHKVLVQANLFLCSTGWGLRKPHRPSGAL